MADLPLFPLNTVLFPGMQLKLHIFEERYKTMINQCVEQEKPFGVVLIQDGQEALGPLATPHKIGCTAQITQVQRLPYDRMNIVAIGEERFHINTIKQTNPFLIADVDFFAPQRDNEREINKLSRVLRPLIIDYLDVLSKIEDIQFESDQIPHSPNAIVQIASILLQAESDMKQDLLRTEEMSLLLRKLVEIYSLETILLNVRITPPDDSFDIGPFSSN